MIFFDTETTGLPLPRSSPLSQQPRIVEFACIKTDEDLNKVGEISFLLNPQMRQDPSAVKVHGITDEMLSKEKPFAYRFEEIRDFFFGEKTVVAHNLSFDVLMLEFELRRLDKLLKFPWPIDHVCTVEMAWEKFGQQRVKLEFLYDYYYPETPFVQTHRALDDVNMNILVYEKLRENPNV